MIAHRYGIVNQRLKVIEESHQFINGNGLDRHTGEDKFLMRVTRQMFLESAVNALELIKCF